MKKRTGCLGIIVIILLLFAVFLFWPSSSGDQGVILSDSFDNNDNRWDLQNSAKIENGELLIPAGGDTVIIPSNMVLKNGNISVDMEYKSGDKGNVFGIMFRSPAEEDGFDLFLIDSRGDFILRYNGKTDLAERSGYISKEGTNSLMAELYGKLIRISVNGNTVVEVYEDNPAGGGFALFSGGDSEVAFDNLEVKDFDKLSPNISGKVYYNDGKLADAPVTAYMVVDDKTLKVAVIDETRTDENGEYSFYLPGDASYFVESTVENGKISSDRYADLRIPGSGLDLDIHLTAEGE